MATSIADLSELLEGIPSGAWVAISESRHAVVAFGPDAQDVLRDAKAQGEEHPLLTRVPEQNFAMFY